MKNLMAGFMLAVSCFAVRAAEVQHDVRAFQANAEECQHFAGEWDNTLPKSRQKEIEAAVDKYCTLAREQQEQLKKRYRGNRQVEELLSQYDF